MIRLCPVLIFAFSVLACRPLLLPTATLDKPVPRCGAHPIAPRAPDGDLTYFACQVDVASSPPRDRPVPYPEMLARANVEGTVELQFVVDAHGRVDPATIVVLASAHELFTQAARQALLAWRTTPAMRRGTAVREIVTHAFCFRIAPIDKGSDCGRSVRQYPQSDISLACQDASTRVTTAHGGSNVLPPMRPGGRCHEEERPTWWKGPLTAALPPTSIRSSASLVETER